MTVTPSSKHVSEQQKEIYNWWQGQEAALQEMDPEFSQSVQDLF